MKIIRKNSFLLIVSLLFFSYCCKGQRQNQNTDSFNSELSNLIKNLLKWHEVDRKGDFSPLVSNSNDSVYSGIDWEAYEKRAKELSETNLFTKEFLNNYKIIALYLDKELKQNPIKYRVGELPPYGDGASEWCNCQDYPLNVWERLKITNVKAYNDSASFQWTWGNDFYYSVKTKKESGSWKISYLEGFDIKNFTW